MNANSSLDTTDLRGGFHHRGLINFIGACGGLDVAPLRYATTTPPEAIEQTRKTLAVDETTVEDAIALRLARFKDVSCGEMNVEQPYTDPIDVLMQLLPHSDSTVDWVCFERDGKLSASWVTAEFFDACLNEEASPFDLHIDQPSEETALAGHDGQKGGAL
jgi:hypothetical protein